ncbi:hypothetical protein DSO57_1003924 [Entomophthora muscae]|uniref:Uncharacterized protein n=1 Tax=Entomophthora muscae TaxID=34485 RepID=A0ACC2SAH9_9FUNG|nr:hypothetical protein DSO57_1003924 [Entomophthora muscae]
MKTLVRQMYEMPQLLWEAQVALAMIALWGALLNLCVIYCVVIRRVIPLRADTCLTLMIAVFDMVACVFSLSAEVLRLAGTLTLKTPVFCHLDLFLFGTSTFGSLAMTTVLSFIRYLNVVRGWRVEYKNCFTNALAFLGVVWIVILARGLSNPLVLMPSGLYCMPFAEKASGAKSILEVLYPLVILPCPFIIFISYGCIIRHYHQELRAKAAISVHQIATDLSHSRTLIQSLRNQFVRAHFKNITKLLLILLAYAICLLPEFTMSTLALLFKWYRPNWVDQVAFLAIFSLAIINPIIVLHIHLGSAKASKTHPDSKGSDSTIF